MLICRHFNLSWLNVRDDLDMSDYTCLLAVALKQDERRQYEWWVNSRQDPKKFKFTEDKSNPFDKIFALATKMGGIIKGSPVDYIKATMSDYVFIDKEHKFYNKRREPIEFNPRQNRNVVVVRLEDGGEL
jgi:hypothetical protein